MARIPAMRHASTDSRKNLESVAAADPGVKIAGVFPPETHPPIVYPIALTADSRDPAAGRLLDFLTSPAAKPIFEKHGFTAAP